MSATTSRVAELSVIAFAATSFLDYIRDDGWLYAFLAVTSAVIAALLVVGAHHLLRRWFL